MKAAKELAIPAAKAATERLAIGVPGLEEILGGGLIREGVYLVRGGPGTGKTILGLHFLTAGAANKERCLFITLGEPEAQIRRNAAALGFDLAGITFLDLSPAPEFFTESQSYDIFYPAEVERGPTAQKIIERLEALKPQRVFLDAMTQFRYLTTDAFEFHKQAFSFLRFLVKSGATVLFTSESSAQAPDDDLQFMSDGVIQLEYSNEERTVSVLKFRGSGFRGGSHVLRLTEAGMEVPPLLVPNIEEEKGGGTPELISSGVPELDKLLHGGVERGTITLLTGPSGVGKTTLGVQFIKEAVGRGEHAVVYVFEEGLQTLLTRCEAVNLPIRSMMERGILSIVRVEPMGFTADEFAHLIRHEVDQNHARIVMLDSIAGYRLCLRGKDLVSHLHALCMYLKHKGVTLILVNEVETVTGNFRITEVGVSYLADNIIFLRYLEIDSQLRKVIGVLKKRMSDFEKTLREIEITRCGIRVGEPLTRLRGILSGTPEWVSGRGDTNEY